MATGSKVINEIEKFQHAVSSLSSSINKVSIDWNDEKHAKLVKLINNIAGKSKRVLNLGQQLKSQLNRFDSIE